MKSQNVLRNICSTILPGPRYHVAGRVFAASTVTSIPQVGVRHATTPSSSRWLSRQKNDPAAKEAELKGLRSRAGIKILEIDMKYQIFQSGQTVVDLGYAPGSWTQVAVDKTAPDGRVLGIDIIPALPPKGASTMQGDFTSDRIQGEMKKFLSNPMRGRPLKASVAPKEGEVGDKPKGEVEAASQTYIEQERAMMKEEKEWAKAGTPEDGKNTVDVVLSDMLEPFPMVTGKSKASLSRPHRLMSTSGNPFRDQVGSIRLCNKALAFSIDVLRPGGSFVCKFYQSRDSTLLEKKLRKVYREVHLEKPKSSRPDSKEMYFVALKKRPNVDKEKVMSLEPTD